jgi:hypothetical protein
LANDNVPRDAPSVIATSERLGTRFPAELQKLFNATSMIIKKLTQGTDIAATNRLAEDNDVQKALELLHPAHFFLLAEVAWFLKVYDSSLSDDDRRNYYLEREWRKVNGNVSFGSDDVQSIVLPSAKYVEELALRIPWTRDKIRVLP